LDDARELLTEPRHEPNRSDHRYRHLAAARYLAGYVVECILKVYIIERTRTGAGIPAQTWGEVLDARETSNAKPDLSGAKSHLLAALLAATDLEEQLDGDPHLRASWSHVAKWDVAQRYMAAPLLNRSLVYDFVDACEELYHWVRNRV